MPAGWPSTLCLQAMAYKRVTPPTSAFGLTELPQAGPRLHSLVALRCYRARGGAVGRPALEVRVLDVAHKVRLHRASGQAAQEARWRVAVG